MIARKNIARNFFLLITVTMICCGGCKKKEPDFDVISLEGTVEKIELSDDDTGFITLRYHSEKHAQEMVGKGKVTGETEILINGAAAKLSDVREGDRVRGEVRVDKVGDEKKQTALKIYIDRAKPIGE